MHAKIEQLRLVPGDVLVITVASFVTDSQAAGIMDAARSCLPADVRVLVLPDTVGLTVLNIGGGE